MKRNLTPVNKNLLGNVLVLATIISIGTSAYAAEPGPSNKKIDEVSLTVLSKAFDNWDTKSRHDAIMSILAIARAHNEKYIKIAAIDHLAVPAGQLAGEVRGLAIGAIAAIAKESESEVVELKAISVLRGGLESYVDVVKSFTLDQIKEIGVNSASIKTKISAIAAIGNIWSPNINQTFDQIVSNVSDQAVPAACAAIDEIRRSVKK